MIWARRRLAMVVAVPLPVDLLRWIDALFVHAVPRAPSCLTAGTRGIRKTSKICFPRGHRTVYQVSLVYFIWVRNRLHFVVLCQQCKRCEHITTRTVTFIKALP
jgi:hypothetical protein